MLFSIINTITSWFLKKRIHQIELFKKYPIEVQNEVLLSLIKKAENTEIGKNYDFKSIKDYKSFSKRSLLLVTKNFTPKLKDLLKEKTTYFGAQK